jgi:hypothetical protein
MAVNPATRSEVEFEALKAVAIIAAEIGAIRKEVAGIRAAVAAFGPSLQSIDRHLAAIAQKK